MQSAISVLRVMRRWGRENKMTDQELLELAARAAGIDGWYEREYLSFIKRSGGCSCPWNPLEDDGDALRLAVKLGLDVEMHGCLTTFPSAIAFDCMRNIAEEEQPADGDPFAATRRAIVRAAAALALVEGVIEMKYRYYITDLNAGAIVGTNDKDVADSYALSEDNYVVDAQSGTWISPCGEQEIKEVGK